MKYFKVATVLFVLFSFSSGYSSSFPEYSDPNTYSCDNFGLGGLGLESSPSLVYPGSYWFGVDKDTNICIGYSPNVDQHYWCTGSLNWDPQYTICNTSQATKPGTIGGDVALTCTGTFGEGGKAGHCSFTAVEPTTYRGQSDCGMRIGSQL